MTRKRKDADKMPVRKVGQPTLKLSLPAHHLLKVLSSWLNVDQKELVHQLLLKCLEEQPQNLTVTIEAWMIYRYGSGWKEELLAR